MDVVVGFKQQGPCHAEEEEVDVETTMIIQRLLLGIALFRNTPNRATKGGQQH